MPADRSYSRGRLTSIFGGAIRAARGNLRNSNTTPLIRTTCSRVSLFPVQLVKEEDGQGRRVGGTVIASDGVQNFTAVYWVPSPSIRSEEAGGSYMLANCLPGSLGPNDAGEGRLGGMEKRLVRTSHRNWEPRDADVQTNY